MKDAAERTGLHPHTLRKYADNGIIPSIRIPSGHRLLDVESWIKDQKPQITTICYCRVSSHKQKDDLQRQIEYVKKKYDKAEVITDIASGLNFKRKGLKTILERVLQGDSIRLVVAHRDRLARFGFDLIQWLVEQNGGELVVLHKSDEASPTEELTQDLLAILGVFAARMHGLRKYRDQIKKDSDISKQSNTENIQTVD